MASRLLGNEVDRRVLVRCWGDFAVENVARDAQLRGRKARALLAYLALHPGKAISRERLAGLLWGDRAEEQARGSLRQTVFELRAFAHGGEPLLRVDREAIAIEAEAVRTDADLFRELLDTGAFGALLDALPDPDEIFLANLDGVDAGFDEWLQIERTRQRDALVQLVGDASAGAIAAGQVRLARALHARLVEMGGAPPEHPDIETGPLAPAPDRSRAAKWVVRAPLLLGAALLAGVAASAPWWVPRPAATSEALHREALGLYTSALPMIRDRGIQLKSAVELLRRAVVLEPDFAKGWAALATALAIHAESEQDTMEAERYARRALALDPDLAEAHAALGMILGFRGPEAGAHLKRAVALNPRDPQAQFWLSNHFGTMLEFGPRLAALRRAVALDPYGGRGTNQAALAAWDLGYREEARSYWNRLTSFDPQEAFDCDYQLDLADGEYASIVRKLLAARARVDKPVLADQKLGSALLILGHTEPARLLLRMPDYQWTIASGRAPSPAEFRQVERNSAGDWLDSQIYLSLAMQKLLSQGRSRELVALFDARGPGHLGQLAGAGDDRALLVDFGPEMALALRAVGRTREADVLLRRVETEVRRAYAAGPVPDWFDVDLARLRAAQGRRDEALAALGRAIRRGWHYAPVTPMPDIADIYVFRELRGDARFEALRRRLLAHLERERRALGPSPV